jgi:hypothetical protein
VFLSSVAALLERFQEQKPVFHSSIGHRRGSRQSAVP